MVTRVLICFGDNPGRSVAHTKVENLALLDDSVEGLHEFRNGGGEVPPVDVEYIKVVGLEFAERGCEGNVQGLGVIAREVGLYDVVVAFITRECSGVFCRKHHLVTKTGARLKPFADPHFGLLVLVIVCRVNEVAALVMEIVKEFKNGFFLHGAHHTGPRSKSV